MSSNKSLRELARSWGRKTVARTVHFALDRLLEIDAVLEDERDEWLDELDDEMLEASFDEVVPPRAAPAKLPLDTRWKHIVDRSKLRRVRFVDMNGTSRFTLEGTKAGLNEEQMSLFTEAWPEVPFRILGLTASLVADSSVRGLISDLHQECDDQQNLLPTGGWMFMDAFVPGRKGPYDLPALSSYPMVSEQEEEYPVVVTVGVWGKGTLNGELALIVEVLGDAENEDLPAAPPQE